MKGVHLMEYTCTMKTGSRESQWIATISPITHTRSFYEVEITGRGSTFHIIAGPHSNGHFLCIPNWEVGCELAAYNDIFWNSEKISKQLSAVDTITVASGLLHLSEAFKK